MFKRAAPSDQEQSNPFIAAVVKAGGNDIVEVLPENWPAFALFLRIRTQWTVGFGGPTGLRYEALYPLLDRITQSSDEWDDLFADVREIEAGALESISEKNK